MQVSGLTGAVELSVGDHHACVRTDDGALYCWGANGNGQLGDGTTQTSPVPVPVQGFEAPPQVPAAGTAWLLLLAAGLAGWARHAAPGLRPMQRRSSR